MSSLLIIAFVLVVLVLILWVLSFMYSARINKLTDSNDIDTLINDVVSKNRVSRPVIEEYYDKPKGVFSSHYDNNDNVIRTAKGYKNRSLFVNFVVLHELFHYIQVTKNPKLVKAYTSHYYLSYSFIPIIAALITLVLRADKITYSNLIGALITVFILALMYVVYALFIEGSLERDASLSVLRYYKDNSKEEYRKLRCYIYLYVLTKDVLTPIVMFSCFVLYGTALLLK